ncbi:MAG: hypothetical protein OEW35_03780 [Gammaproteobacteria bacterium]|nr:hypothetical protein [Gammaproteobacteria bacterium]MDH4253476.1 hypothetical protein [Gammaproteobacteria bacterium]MDH5309709.1 hypothetical protein [Gammaproteobacteria bacterium]
MIRPLLAITCVLLASCSQRTDELRLVMPVLAVDQGIAEQLANNVGARSDLDIDLVPLPEGMTALDALSSGYADLAFEANTHPYRDGIATVMPLYPTVLHIVVREERVSADPARMLAGATVYAGPPDSASRLAVERIMTRLGLGEGAVRFAEDTSVPVDVLIVYAPIDRERLQAGPDFDGMVLLSFGAADEIGKGGDIDRAVLLNPRVRPFVIPAGIYGDLAPGPVLTLAVDQLLVARADLPDATVYDLVGEILRLAPVLSGERPEAFQRLDGDFDAGGWAFGLHAGALAFLHRDEPTFAERYSGVAEVIVTLLLAAGSGIFAAVKIYRIRRKNRIDVFYTDVIRIRDSVDRDASMRERREAIANIRALQNRAFELLVNERLAADDSFRIFITLADDAIRELREASSG